MPGRHRQVQVPWNALPRAVCVGIMHLGLVRHHIFPLGNPWCPPPVDQVRASRLESEYDREALCTVCEGTYSAALGNRRREKLNGAGIQDRFYEGWAAFQNRNRLATSVPPTTPQFAGQHLESWRRGRHPLGKRSPVLLVSSLKPRAEDTVVSTAAKNSASEC